MPPAIDAAGAPPMPRRGPVTRGRRPCGRGGRQPLYSGRSARRTPLESNEFGFRFPMKLIGALTSPYVRKVRIVMAEKKLDYQFELEDVWTSDAILKSNPLG